MMDKFFPRPLAGFVDGREGRGERKGSLKGRKNWERREREGVNVKREKLEWGKGKRGREWKQKEGREITPILISISRCLCQVVDKYTHTRLTALFPGLPR